MPFAIAAPVVGAVAGAATSSLLAPGTSGGSSSLYVPTGLSAEDQQWQAIQNQLYNTYQNAGLNQYGLGSLQSGVNANNQYAPGLQSAANAAGSQYGNLANTLNQQSQQNYGTQQALLNAGQQVYNLGLDPNQALYNQTLNNVQQQTGATNSQYGLGSSGVGAGVQNQALNNFNIGWNAQQLQNAATGLSAYDQAAAQAGSYGQLANQQGSAAPAAQLQAGQVPYTTAQGIAAVPGQLGNTYGQYLNQNVYGPGQTLQSVGQNYLNYGAGLNTTAFNANNQGAGALGSAVSQGISGLGSQAQNLSNYFGGSSGFGGGVGAGYGGYGGFGSAPSSSYGLGANTYGFTT